MPNNINVRYDLTVIVYQMVLYDYEASYFVEKLAMKLP